MPAVAWLISEICPFSGFFSFLSPAYIKYVDFFFRRWLLPSRFLCTTAKCDQPGWGRPDAPWDIVTPRQSLAGWFCWPGASEPGAHGRKTALASTQKLKLMDLIHPEGCLATQVHGSIRPFEIWIFIKSGYASKNGVVLGELSEFQTELSLLEFPKEFCKF